VLSRRSAGEMTTANSSRKRKKGGGRESLRRRVRRERLESDPNKERGRKPTGRLSP